MTTSSKIIGVGGRDRSGKDTVAELLMDAGYFGFSFGDFTRAEARKRHANDPNPISVANMTETSNYLRDTYGPDVILQAALKAYEEAQTSGVHYKGLVLYSLRAPVEVDFVLAKGGELVWVETSDEIRLARRKSAHREGEAKVTLEDMLAQEALQEQPQSGIPVEAQMNLRYVQEHATIIIENEGNDIEAFKERAKKALEL